MCNNWVYGGTLAALVILALSPLFLGMWSWAMTSIFLQLPIYMLHQYEEHDNGRFGRFINDHVGKGKLVLSAQAIFVINVPGVWGVNVLSIWLAAKLNIGLGLIGIYLTFINGLIHILPALRMRTYNPGLITAVLLLLPAGLWGLVSVSATSGIGFEYHALGIGLAVIIHVAIVAYVFGKRALLNA